MYNDLTVDEFEDILYENMLDVGDSLNSKEMIFIDDAYASFCDDESKNIFYCAIYKTAFGKDKWFMLMKDDKEGYAIYINPSKNEKELAWYHKNLEEPLTPDEELKLITCYVPKSPYTKS